MKKLLLFLLITTAVYSCNRVKSKAKDAINKGGETVGKGATEFFEGVAEGVDRSLQCELILSQALQDKGLRTGKFSINNDSTGGKNNLLSLYLIFDKDIKESVSVKAFDKKGLETGRVRMTIEGKAGDANYHDFLFDKRTYIEVKSKISID